MNIRWHFIKFREKLGSHLVPESIQLNWGSEDRLRARALVTFFILLFMVTIPNAIYVTLKFREQVSFWPLMLYGLAMAAPFLLLRWYRDIKLSINVFVLGLLGFILFVYVFYDRIMSPITNWIPVLMYFTIVTTTGKNRNRLLLLQMVSVILAIIFKIQFGEQIQYFPAPAQFDGRRIILSLVFSCLCIYFLTGAFFELNSLDRKEQKTLEPNSLLDQGVASNRNLATGIIYEISQPLTLVAGHLQLAQKKCEALDGSPELQDLVGSALLATQRMQTLMERLKSWTETDFGNEGGSAFILNDVVDKVIKSKSKEINSQQVTIEKIIPPVTLPSKLKATEFILNELLDNAVQSSSFEGVRRIYIKAELNFGWIEIQVANTNPKRQKEDDVAMMFDPLVSQKELGQANRFGLSLVLALIGHLNGKLSYVRDDHYTIFTVYLPLVGQDVSEDVA